jgi:peptidyl-prolyl cis-trans isomerase B (cyclophilin B)
VAATGTVDVTLHMDAGDVVLDLDRSMAPCATNSLVWLAEQGYFDDTSCHRLVPGFVLQCGDPTGKGTGGPGYRFNDELSGRETYPYGTVAMANAGPNTNGSQFFIVIGEDVKLDPAYTVMGTVSQASMSVVDTIAAAGVDPTDPQGTRPAQGGHITSASVA